MAKEFISDGEYIYVNTDYAEAYVPNVLFKSPDEQVSSIAYEYGNGFKLIGIFSMRFFPTEVRNREKVKLRTFNYPNLIETYPSDSSIETLELDEEPERYRVLKYERGDVMMAANTAQSVDNCETFMQLVATGKIPRALSYPDVYHSWMANFAINGIGPAVPPVVLQTMVAWMCRVPNDPSNQFRMVAGKGGANMNDYLSMSMNEVTAYSSVMSALSFERVAEKLTTSLNMTKEGTPQKKSPIEQVMSY